RLVAALPRSLLRRYCQAVELHAVAGRRGLTSWSSVYATE
ncbi:hypothetical protein HaLaN_30405, partial [Haematococcus lacustris]